MSEAKEEKDSQLKGLRKKKIIGGSYALTIEESMTGGDNPTPALNIEAAAKLDPNNRESKAFDWKNKIIFQMNQAEMMEIVKFFSSDRKSVSFNNHGPANDKRFEIEQQDNKYPFKIKVGQGSTLRVVPVTSFDAQEFLALIVKKIKDNSPWLSVSEIIELSTLMDEKVKSIPKEKTQSPSR